MGAVVLMEGGWAGLEAREEKGPGLSDMAGVVWLSDGWIIRGVDGLVRVDCKGREWIGDGGG